MLITVNNNSLQSVYDNIRFNKDSIFIFRCKGHSLDIQISNTVITNIHIEFEGSNELELTECTVTLTKTFLVFESEKDLILDISTNALNVYGSNMQLTYLAEYSSGYTEYTHGNNLISIDDAHPGLSRVAYACRTLNKIAKDLKVDIANVVSTGEYIAMMYTNMAIVYDTKFVKTNFLWNDFRVIEKSSRNAMYCYDSEKSSLYIVDGSSELYISTIYDMMSIKSVENLISKKDSATKISTINFSSFAKAFASVMSYMPRQLVTVVLDDTGILVYAQTALSTVVLGKVNDSKSNMIYQISISQLLVLLGMFSESNNVEVYSNGNILIFVEDKLCLYMAGMKS